MRPHRLLSALVAVSVSLSSGCAPFPAVGAFPAATAATTPPTLLPLDELLAQAAAHLGQDVRDLHGGVPRIEWMEVRSGSHVATAVVSGDATRVDDRDPLGHAGYPADAVIGS